MQQLDGKWGRWFQQSQSMSDNLRQQMGLLTSQHETSMQRLVELENQVLLPLTVCQCATADS